MKTRFYLLAVTLGLAALGQARAQEEPTTPVTWQEMMALGLVPYRQLTVDDFPIDDKAHPKHTYYIATGTVPQYHFQLKLYNGFAYAHVQQWTVFSGLDKNKSSRKSTFKR